MRLDLGGSKDTKFTGVVVAMHSREECTVPLNNGCFTPVVFSAYGALPVDGSVWSSFADVEGVTSVGHQLRVPSYGSLQDKMVSRLDWLL